MAQLRVSEWTLDRLHEIKEVEEHSSLDSVVKTLLKERENDEL